ncbi:MAG: hypothetical protein IJ529_05970 [Alphaproteobacteria bacterium]|nr:hypothetical protein [Alphaproteobacteria bacterium]MBQ8677996.1 hypothetical protein [Alphaproteobacteria bacterium]
MEGFKGNYITVINNKAIAVVDGQEVPMPSVLFNEIGVGYYFVDFYEHGTKMAKKHGIYYAVKQEPIRVWKNVKPGECIKTVIDGYEEHQVQLDENSVAAQNVVKNEFYAIPKKVLAEKYKFDHSEFDYDLYIPKSDAVSQWAYSDVNVFGVLWGGFEFLTTPMINITKEDDCYGCNYIVWWGNDGRLSSYKVVGYFRACGTLFYEQPMAIPVAALEATFEPPKMLIA